MKLLSIELENFLSFKHAKEMLNERGLVLVLAENLDSVSASSNGSGKSALYVDAVPWCLFGQTVREKVFGNTTREFSANDVVNEDAENGCRVSVQFQVRKEQYCVIRYRKHSSRGNTVELYRVPVGRGKKEHVSLTGETVAETNELICQLIGMTYSSYCNSVIFAQGAVRRFTQCTDSERRKILEDFSDLSVFDAARELVKKDRDSCSDQIRALEDRITGANASYDTVLDEHGRAVDEIDDFKAARKTAKTRLAREMAEHEVRLKQLSDKERKLRKELVTQEAELGDLNLRCLGSATRRGFADDRDAAKDAATRLEVSMDRAARDTKALRRRKSNFKAGDSCPECLRDVSVSDVKTYKASLEARIVKLERNYADSDKQVRKHQTKLRECQAVLEADAVLLSEKEELCEDIAYTKRSLKELALDVEKVKGAGKLTKASVKAHDDKLRSLETNEDRLRGKAAFIKEQIRVHEGKVAKKLVELERYDFWYTGFGSHGIKDYCYDRLLRFLNEKLVYYTQALTGGEIQVSLKKGPKGQIALDVDIQRGSKTYVMSSGGQSRRIDLCLALAMQSLVESSVQAVNLAVIDEFDAGLDEAGLNMFVDHLQSEVARKGSLFLITHNAGLATHFANVQTIRFQDGESRMVA